MDRPRLVMRANGAPILMRAILSLLVFIQFTNGEDLRTKTRILEDIASSGFICICENAAQTKKENRLDSFSVTRVLKGQQLFKQIPLLLNPEKKHRYLVYGSGTDELAGVQVMPDDTVVFPIKQDGEWIEIVFRLRDLEELIRRKKGERKKVPTEKGSGKSN